MPLLVQKFGGTSVADSDKILAAARRAIQAHNRGDQVLMVVSARGHTTDELIALAKEITETPPAREMDMLLSTGEQVSVALMAMAIESLGVPAISFTGAQIGLVTDSFHTKARIRNISTERMVQALGEGKIVIVAGFQGVDENYNITTLGRGGSDTTAVALAAVLGADGCEIYTDVDGVYTTDPRIVPEARKIDRISYDEMLELASLGAGVMHSRSIEFAKKYGVPIHVRSSFSDAPGTWIVGEHDARRLGVAGHRRGAGQGRGADHDPRRARPPRRGPRASSARSRAANIVVDMIVQNVSTGGTTEVSFTVAKGDLPETLRAAEAAAQEIGASGVTHDAEVAKVSVVGLGMRDAHRRRHHDVRGAGRRRHQHPDDHDQRDQDQRAGRSGLGRRRAPRRPPGVPARAAQRRRASSPFVAVRHAAGHEARPAGRGRRRRRPSPGPSAWKTWSSPGSSSTSRRPGSPCSTCPTGPATPARVFRAIAEAGVFVDMIVQNIGIAGRFRPVVHRAARCGRPGRRGRPRPPGSRDVSVEPAMAKLSVIGVGMRTHTGVATRMFAALAERGINVNLINTSEVRINVGTDIARGREGLECLRRAFAL